MKNVLVQGGVTIHPWAAIRPGCWRRGKTSRGRCVEKPEAEEPSAQRFLEWVVRNPVWSCGRDLQAVEKTGVIRLPGWKDGFDHARYERTLAAGGCKAMLGSGRREDVDRASARLCNWLLISRNASPSWSGAPPLYEKPRPRNSSRQASLNARKGSIPSLSKKSPTSRKVLFGARYVSMITRTTLSAFSTILGDDSTRILLANA